MRPARRHLPAVHEIPEHAQLILVEVLADVLEMRLGLVLEARPYATEVERTPLGKLLENCRTCHLQKERKEAGKVEDIGHVRRQRDARPARRLLDECQRL